MGATKYEAWAMLVRSNGEEVLQSPALAINIAHDDKKRALSAPLWLFRTKQHNSTPGLLKVPATHDCVIYLAR
jgi:hypothetical protein